MTTEAPFESDDADSGWKMALTIIATFLGCAVVGGLLYLCHRFCCSATTENEDVESASAPPLPLEYIPDQPCILDVD